MVFIKFFYIGFVVINSVLLTPLSYVFRSHFRMLAVILVSHFRFFLF